MKYLIFLALILSSLLVFSGCVSEKSIDFETISKETYDSRDVSVDYNLITNSSYFNLFWENSYNSNKPLPEIDFSKDMVIIVYLGQIGGCNSIKVDKVLETEDFLEIYVKEKIYDGNDMCIQAFWNQSEIIKIPIINKPIAVIGANASN